MAVDALSARAVALVFLLPMGLPLPVKLFAVWLMGHHRVVTGCWRGRMPGWRASQPGVVPVWS